MRIRRALRACLKSLKFLPLFVLLVGRLAFAQGGPPLITDDPGTPGDGHWEINLAAQYFSEQGSDSLAAPYVDANYGWGEALQLKVEGGVLSTVKGFSPSEHGGSDLLAGVKWRFYDNEKSGFAISTYPQIQFGAPFTSKNQLYVNPGTLYILPIEISQEFGKWTLNPEIGLIHSTENQDVIFSGLAAGYTVAEFRELLVELYSQHEVRPVNDKLLFFNVGTRWLITNGLSFIGSAGHTLQTFLGDPPQFMSYAGVQIRL